MDPVTLSLPAAAAAAAALNSETLQHYPTGTGTEMILLSPRSSCTTFSALELNAKKGLPNQSSACALLFLLLQLVFACFLQERAAYKQIKHGNWKNDWTFSLAEDGGCQ